MAKKKKTALKPVARGFATTSVPKKVTQEPEPEPEETAAVAEPEEVAHNDNASKEPIKADGTYEFDPEKVEEQSLQNLIDKFQDKTEKEVARNVKVAESQTYLEG
jgi:ATP-dependent RNA helicase DHX29